MMLSDEEVNSKIAEMAEKIDNDYKGIAFFVFLCYMWF